jgi:hypothetical protein
MKITNLLSVLALLFFAYSSQAQEVSNTSNTTTSKTNIVKLGFSSHLLFNPEAADGGINGIAGIGAGIEHCFGHGSFSINAHYMTAANDFDSDGTILYDRKVHFLAIEPDFRIYTKRNARGLYLGLGFGYSSWKAIPIVSSPTITVGQLNVTAKLGFQTNLSEKLSLHFNTGLGVLAGGSDTYHRSFLTIPIATQLGYRF